MLERASTPQLLVPLMDSEDMKNMLQILPAHCGTVYCYGWGEVGRFLLHTFFSHCASRLCASMALSKHEDPAWPYLPGRQGACARGGGGDRLMARAT